MATAAAPRQLVKRPIPDDGVVYREYAHQIMAKGEYGAYSRTARVCGVSHVHVRNVVERVAPKKVEVTPEVEELAYQPAPGQEEHENEILLRQLLGTELVTTPIEITSTPSVVVTETTPEVVTIEPDYLAIPYSFNSNGPDRTYCNQRYELRLYAIITLLLTIIDVLVGYKALGLTLLLLPGVLGMWWVVAQMNRLLYWQK